MSTFSDDVTEREGFLREVSKKELFQYFYLSIPLLAVFVAAAILAGFWIEPLAVRIPVMIVCSIGAYIFLRRLVLGCVLMYKAYAPMSVREQCRYTPTCSTYALIAVMKYGILIGVTLSILRIHRCRPPYGGVDYPSLSHLGRIFRK